jgi:polar amino acid transport system ATP-binding protein/sulfate transport system ATP-binding protein
MDEPFSGLDLLAVERVTKFIADIAKTDELKTFVLVTHDVAAALAICDTVWVMGRDRDASGNIIPGARIHSTFNLIDREIAWVEGSVNSPQFFSTLKEIRELFPKL